MENKTKEQLILELAAMRQQVVEMEKSEAEHKRTEQELRKSQEMLKSITQGISDVILLISKDFRILWANKAALEAYGSDIVGDYCYKATHQSEVPCEPPLDPCPIFELRKTGKPVFMHHNHKDAHGNKFHVEVGAYPVMDEKGEIFQYIHFCRDITERKQTEEAIRESEERYKTIFDNIEDGYYEVDLAGNFTIFNDSLCKIWGYSRAEMGGMNNRYYMDKETSKKVYQAFNRVYTTGDPRKAFEYKIIRKDGTEGFLESSISLKRNAKSEPVGFRGIARDITYRKQAEEALRRSEDAAQRLAQENALVAEMGRIIGSTLNIEDVFEHFSGAVAKLISFDRIQINLGSLPEDDSYVRYVAGTDVPDRRSGEYVPLTGTATVECFRTKSSLLLQPKDAKEVEELGVRFPRLLPNLKAGMRSAILVPLITKDETIGVLSLRTTKTKAYTDQDVRLVESIASQIAGAVANAQSFAELKQAEEALRNSEKRYQQLVEQPFLGVYAHREGQIFFMNQAAARILGAEGPSMYVGKTVFSFIHPDYHEIVKERIQAIYTTAKLAPLFDEKFVRLDGKTIDVEIAASIHTYEGRPAVQVIFQDITERKQVEAERERLVGELQKALSEVKTLRGIFPICASCKKIRDDKGYWTQIEVYIRDRSEAQFSHGICPECKEKLYGDFLREVDISKKK